MDIPITKILPKPQILNRVLVITAGYIFTIAAINFFFVGSNHWTGIFRPAALALASGRSPYGFGFYNPPWALLPIIPISILPAELGYALMFIANIMAYTYVASKLNAGRLLTAFFVLSPWALRSSVNTNLDWMVALGFILPPQIGLFFVLVKPQIGVAVAIFWAVEAWREGKMLQLVKTFAPVSFILAISFLLYGFWPLYSQNATNYIHLWPYVLPAGLALLISAIRQRRKDFAIMASPFLSPYLNPPSLPVGVLGLLPRKAETCAAIIGLWIIYLLGGQDYGTFLRFYK